MPGTMYNDVVYSETLDRDPPASEYSAGGLRNQLSQLQEFYTVPS